MHGIVISDNEDYAGGMEHKEAKTQSSGYETVLLLFVQKAEWELRMGISSTKDYSTVLVEI